MVQAARKPTNLSLDIELVSEARRLNVNLSRAAEEGLARAVAQAQEDAWKQENADAIKSANAWVEENGLPLDRFRNF